MFLENGEKYFLMGEEVGHVVRKPISIIHSAMVKDYSRWINGREIWHGIGGFDV